MSGVKNGEFSAKTLNAVAASIRMKNGAIISYAVSIFYVVLMGLTVLAGFWLPLKKKRSGEFEPECEEETVAQQGCAEGEPLISEAMV